MLRKVLSIVTIIVAIILLFLLVRTLVGTFTGKPKPTDTKPGSSISQKAKDDAAKATTPKEPATPTPATNPATPTPVTTPTPVATPTGTNPATGTSTTSNTATNDNLVKTGPGETALAIFAGTAALGAMYLVRRKQLANL